MTILKLFKNDYKNVLFILNNDYNDIYLSCLIDGFAWVSNCNLFIKYNNNNNDNGNNNDNSKYTLSKYGLLLINNDKIGESGVSDDQNETKYDLIIDSTKVSEDRWVYIELNEMINKLYDNDYNIARWVNAKIEIPVSLFHDPKQFV